MSAEKHLNPSDFSDEQVERLVFAIIGKLSNYGFVVKPLKGKEAMRQMGLSSRTFYKWVDLGIIIPYRPDPDGDPVYFLDQMVEGAKNAGKRLRKS